PARARAGRGRPCPDRAPRRAGRRPLRRQPAEGAARPLPARIGDRGAAGRRAVAGGGAPGPGRRLRLERTRRAAGAGRNDHHDALRPGDRDLRRGHQPRGPALRPDPPRGGGGVRVAIEQRFGPLDEWRSPRGLFAGLAALGLVVLVVLALTTDRFLSVENIKAILSSASIVG